LRNHHNKNKSLGVIFKVRLKLLINGNSLEKRIGIFLFLKILPSFCSKKKWHLQQRTSSSSSEGLLKPISYDVHVLEEKNIYDMQWIVW